MAAQYKPGDTLPMLERCDFLKLLAITGAGSALNPALAYALESKLLLPRGEYAPGRIPNDFSLFLPGEKEELNAAPSVIGIVDGGLTAKLGTRSAHLRPGDLLEGWQLDPQYFRWNHRGQ
jgi:hypothetical protein